MERPIIFIHYGSSEYMRYTLDSARYFNPDKRVILLGDDATKHLCKVLNIEHFHLSDIPSCPELDTFDRVYKDLRSPAFDRQFWVNFIMRRWFLMYSYCLSQGINSFWTFDTDTLILNNLKEQEEKFEAYDGTSQCNGECLNGMVGSLDFVKRYLNKAISLYEDEEYIAEQHRQAAIRTNYFHTEMEVFRLLVLDEKPNVLRLNTIIKGQTFDDCLCQLHDMTPSQYGTKLIVLFQGRLYFHHIPSQSMVEVVTLNMSWIQTEWISRIFFVALDYYERLSDPKEAVTIAVPGPAHCLDNLKK